MSITLTTLQNELLAEFNRQPSRYFSTFELRDAGIAYPAQRVAELKSKGAIIEKIIRPTTDRHGKFHNKVAQYRLKGWS